MNVNDVLKILDDLDMLVLLETLLYKEKSLIEEFGNPTSPKYEKIVELYNLVSELS